MSRQALKTCLNNFVSRRSIIMKENFLNESTSEAIFMVTKDVVSISKNLKQISIDDIVDDL